MRSRKASFREGQSARDGKDDEQQNHEPDHGDPSDSRVFQGVFVLQDVSAPGIPPAGEHKTRALRRARGSV